MFGRVPGHAHHGQHAHPLRRQALIAVLVAALLAAIVLLLLPPKANGNFVYWANDGPAGSIGRAKINGTGANNNFITGQNDPTSDCGGLQVHLLDEGRTPASIGRANLDGSGANPNFITAGVSNPKGIAVTLNNGIYWANTTGSPDSIGHANIDGSNPVANFVTTTSTTSGALPPTRTSSTGCTARRARPERSAGRR